MLYVQLEQQPSGITNADMKSIEEKQEAYDRAKARIFSQEVCVGVFVCACLCLYVRVCVCVCVCTLHMCGHLQCMH